MARRHLLLLPGLLCDAALWRHEVETLADIAEVTVADLTLDDTIPAMAERVLAGVQGTFALAGSGADQGLEEIGRASRPRSI